MATLLKGFPAAKAITQQLLPRVAALAEKGVTPTLAIFRVGEKEDDISYEKGAIKRCGQVGIDVKQIHLPQDVDQETVLRTVEELNADPGVHGVLILRPLPRHIDDRAVCEALAPEKDVDGITGISQAGVYAGTEDKGYPPCTAEACMEILRHYHIPLRGKNAAVIGRSQVIGKPVAMMLLRENATVTICHTKTVKMDEICRRADILIAAAGHIGTVTKEFLNPKQTVIDVAINFDEEGKMKGDVVFEDAEPVVHSITPVPGGVGTVTTSILMKHVVEAAEKI